MLCANGVPAPALSMLAASQESFVAEPCAAHDADVKRSGKCDLHLRCQVSISAAAASSSCNKPTDPTS